MEGTALHIAAFKGSEEVVKILLEQGSNIDLQDDVLIFLSLFISAFLIFICLVFSDVMGVRVRWLCDDENCFVLFLILLFVKCGQTAFHFAAFNGYEETVKILIEHRPDVDLQDDVLISLILFFFSFCFFKFTCCCLNLKLVEMEW